MTAEADLSVNLVAGESRPRAPLFFLSYARSRTSATQVGEFFEDLSEDVAELVGRPVGSDPGFMDRSMSGGAQWRSELLQAVGTCQVFVALLSHPYVTSEWCSKEWYAFSRRKVVSVSADEVIHRTGVVPVVWAPVPEQRLPRVVSDVQRFVPRGLDGGDITALYRDDGVYGFKRLEQKALYRCAVWRLAQAVAEFHFAYQVEPHVLQPAELRDIFREEPS